MTKRDELPLPDYEHLPLETLRHRIRMLDADGVQKLLDYERAHGNRLPVVLVMESWLEELREGAQPSDGHPFELKPEAPPPPAGGPKVSEATAGPRVRPPMRGRPTAPARPFTPPPG
ncbi:hypothetical protein [Geodermatophilus ruber]|uniref:DUF8129 domain-containing protein n=1 Tax=Geodermatophilus ruber TaxID=504800 RepID=A0A1I4D2W4_9ACTN|nr:hypothetical protein [Geodermatophilus ruber]SFK87832.1 hypothetical protein SAMN04488085_104155 [Geodermatophilus ruber]